MEWFSATVCDIEAGRGTISIKEQLLAKED